MKKTILATLLSFGLVGYASAETLKLSDQGITLSNHWAYFIQPDGSYSALKTVNDTALTPNQTASGRAQNYYFLGYDYVNEGGVHYAVSNSDVATLTAPGNWVAWSGHVFVGDKVTISANGIGSGGASWHFSNLAASTDALFSTTVASGFSFDGNLTMTGNLTLSGQTFERTLYSGLINRNDYGYTFVVNGLEATDAAGNKLVYAADADNIGKAGYFWIETSTEGGATTYKLKAKAAASASIPEPATAALGLLALAGLAVRRRRK